MSYFVLPIPYVVKYLNASFIGLITSVRERES